MRFFMKIYIYRYGSICEPDIIDSFKRLGLDVHEECMEIFDKNLTPSECIKRTASDIVDGGYSFVFTINFFPWLSEVCNIANIVYISLIVDSPVLELYSESLSNPCNRIFLFDLMLYKEFAERFIKSNLGTYVFPENSRCNYKALVAQHYISVKVAEQERLRALRMLSDSFNVDMYTGSDTSSMPHINNRGFAKSLEEMPLIFNNSKINLNITAKSIRSGLSLRVFDVLGCGGFLITNYQAELPEFFEIGKDLVAYESMEDLKAKCDYYLKHEDERMEIANHGYETVKKLHTYDTRLIQMIDMAFPAK